MDLQRICCAPMVLLFDIGAVDRQESGLWLISRSWNSHQPFRSRDRAMLRFRGMRSLQKSVAVHSSIHKPFNAECPLSNQRIFMAYCAAALPERCGFSLPDTRKGQGQCRLLRLRPTAPPSALTYSVSRSGRGRISPLFEGYAGGAVHRCYSLKTVSPAR